MWLLIGITLWATGLIDIQVILCNLMERHSARRIKLIGREDE